MSVALQSAPAVKTAAAGTGAVVVLAASGDGSVYRDIVSLIVTTPNAAAATLTLSDGTSTYVLNYPNAAAAPTTPLVIQFCDVPLQASKPNVAWTLTASVNASGFNVVVQYVERQ